VWEASWAGNAPNRRGVGTLLVDPFSCSVREVHQYDTYTSYPVNSAVELSNYLQQLNNGSIVVAVTGDEPTRKLADAWSTLQQFGADVSDVQFRGAFCFVAQKGFPTKTVLRKVLTLEESETQQPHFTVLITGML